MSKKQIDPQFSTEDAAVPVNSLVHLAPLEERPPSQNDPEGAPPVPPVPEDLEPYPGNASKGVFLMADGTVVRNC